MKLTSPCRVCGQDMTTTWRSPQVLPVMIHPQCDTRPVADRHRPHPAEGNLANVAHDAVLALAEAATSPAGSPQWVKADQLMDQAAAIQRNTLFTDLGKAALYYATRLKWPVFPLIPGEKRPLTRNGLYAATTDQHQVAQWWKETPGANIGIATGTNFAVIDVDTPISSTLFDEISNDDDLHVYGMSLTSSGGRHLLIETADGPAKNGVAVFGPNIDFRTTGGYIVAPWSRLTSGKVWQWLIPPAQQIWGGE